MRLDQFRDAVAANPDCSLRIVPQGGNELAPHFHVTEVGRVTKDFIDCGGKPRSETRCVLQTLVANDTDHRLTTTKFTKILALADKLDLPADTEVEVEHQERSISTDRVAGVERVGDALLVTLEPKHTDCLAEDACGIRVMPQLTTLGGECGDTGCC
ncbi:hypothetical protein Mal64_17270 [Pseudobythopirellula maris]|uniref:Uncharacterized protein n=1 Tax=Pseudobythopirellula maris TaxID=2527991 RepID=A0A5C5ZM08_9BACT|nr:DUF6428 family protein [Pseudobythopirellula maris]TWT88248.1 hypothetical protein Mal64_17270 [Pseudobythopirellula maris]